MTNCRAPTRGVSFTTNGTKQTTTSAPGVIVSPACIAV